jgi:hypothetical protein
MNRSPGSSSANRNGPRLVLLAGLLGCAAAARLLLQTFAMPPYAGLDELFHVARVSFTAFAGRSPHTTEPSIPVYLALSQTGERSAPPALSTLGSRWPELARRAPWPDPRVTTDMAGAVTRPNYEAQQPSLYYLIAAELLADPRRQLGELLVLRLFSVVLALAAVFLTAALGWRFFGPIAFVSAALLVSTPTFLTLLVRAGNDAMAVALLSAAMLLSFRTQTNPREWVMEALVWAAAIGTKLYTWPAAIVVALARRHDRQWSRMSLVLLACLIAAVITMADLRMRTGTIFGLHQFRAEVASQAAPFSLIESLKVFISSAIWPGGPHGNALRPLAMLVYAGFPLVLGAVGLFRSAQTRKIAGIVLPIVAAFLLAQSIHAAAFVRRGLISPQGAALGGFEGWYIFALGAVLFGIAGSAALQHAGPLRVVLPVMVLWLIAWDVLIHEGALFRDYSGVTTPRPDDLLFRWGPAPRLGGMENLEQIGVPGLSVSLLYLLRGIHIVATIALTLLVSRWSEARVDSVLAKEGAA